MRIALFSDVYKPVTNGVVHHVAMLKHYLETWGEQVWLFVPGSSQQPDDEPNVIRIPGIPIADTGYHLSIAVDHRSRELLQQMDVIHVHHPFVSGSFGLFFSNRYNIPLVFTNHTRYDLYVKQYLPLLPSALSETALQAYFQIFSQRCAALIAPSESMAEVMRGWGVEGRIVVIPNGIDLDRFENPTCQVNRSQLGIPEDAVVAIYVGRMSGEKSVDRLLRLYRYLVQEEQESHLLLVGSGPELDDYRALAQKLGITDRVTFTGAVPYDEIPCYLKLSDFFVSASVTEVHPLSFIEAAACRLPALGIRSPGVNDLIRNGETGFIAEDNDLSFGLRFLTLVRDGDLRRRMGEAAYAFSRGLSAHNNARRVLQLYQELQ
ncbi:glycosyltransferase [Litorilinea aerophila]|nr:glycosyltransferase [Litorilinea aerophila]MCC9078072.1 glycosyltransferase [Litorilinea aerophila]